MKTKTEPKQSGVIRRTLSRAGAWAKRHTTDLAVLAVLLSVTGGVSGANMFNYPQRFEDEGTYMSQAWAVQYKQSLTHYTYWYDHPPMGWIQIAGYTTLTQSFDRYASAIDAGREYMLLVHLVTIVLLYALARRLKFGYIASAVTVLAYGLSPLSVDFSRYVLLDSIAVPWVLAAFLFAMSRRQHIMMAVASAACMSIGVMSKETFLVFLPALIYALWQYSDKRNRRFVLTCFAVVFGLLSGFYALYAFLKNELLPGKDHVSLLGSIAWQLFGREPSGSLLDTKSASYGLVQYWLSIDKWLLAAGVAAMPLMVWVRNMRPYVLAMLIGCLVVLRGGYLPYPYVIALLPFAALLFGGVVQQAIRLLVARGRGWLKHTGRVAGGLALVALIAASTILVAPAWQTKLQASTSVNADLSSRQAVAWMTRNVPREKRIAVESALWTDLERRGFNVPEPVWLYKTETDPAVAKKLGGWRGIDYLALNGPTLDEVNRKKFPTVFEAKDNGTVVATFGHDDTKVVIIRVNNGK